MINRDKISTSLKSFNPQGKEGTRIKRSFILRMMILPLIALFLSTNQLYAAEEEEIITLIETAQTPEEHIKIAEFYEVQAVKMQEKSTKHAAMARAYKNRSKPWPGMVRHCNKVASDYKEAADEYNNLAAEHRKMAQQLQTQ